MATGERRMGTSARRGMTVLGKIPAVPKPINLPSQKLENRGLDPNVEIVPKGTFSWGSGRSPPTAGSSWGTVDLASSAPVATGAWNIASNVSATSNSTSTVGGLGQNSTRPLSAGSTRPTNTTRAWGAAAKLDEQLQPSRFTLTSVDFPTLGCEKNPNLRPQQDNAAMGRPTSADATKGHQRSVLSASSSNRPTSADGNKSRVPGYSSETTSLRQTAPANGMHLAYAGAAACGPEMYVGFEGNYNIYSSFQQHGSPVAGTHGFAMGSGVYPRASYQPSPFPPNSLEDRYLGGNGVYGSYPPNSFVPDSGRSRGFGVYHPLHEHPGHSAIGFVMQSNVTGNMPSPVGRAGYYGSGEELVEQRDKWSEQRHKNHLQMQRGNMSSIENAQMDTSKNSNNSNSSWKHQHEHHSIGFIPQNNTAAEKFTDTTSMHRHVTFLEKVPNEELKWNKHTEGMTSNKCQDTDKNIRLRQVDILERETQHEMQDMSFRCERPPDVILKRDNYVDTDSSIKVKCDLSTETNVDSEREVALQAKKDDYSVTMESVTREFGSIDSQEGNFIDNSCSKSISPAADFNKKNEIGKEKSDLSIPMVTNEQEASDSKTTQSPSARSVQLFNKSTEFQIQTVTASSHVEDQLSEENGIAKDDSEKFHLADNVTKGHYINVKRKAHSFHKMTKGLNTADSKETVVIPKVHIPENNSPGNSTVSDGNAVPFAKIPETEPVRHTSSLFDTSTLMPSHGGQVVEDGRHINVIQKMQVSRSSQRDQLNESHDSDRLHMNEGLVWAPVKTTTTVHEIKEESHQHNHQAEVKQASVGVSETNAKPLHSQHFIKNSNSRHVHEVKGLQSSGDSQEQYGHEQDVQTVRRNKQMDQINRGKNRQNSQKRQGNKMPEEESGSHGERDECLQMDQLTGRRNRQEKRQQWQEMPKQVSGGSSKGQKEMEIKLQEEEHGINLAFHEKPKIDISDCCTHTKGAKKQGQEKSLTKDKVKVASHLNKEEVTAFISGESVECELSSNDNLVITTSVSEEINAKRLPKFHGRKHVNPLKMQKQSGQANCNNIDMQGERHADKGTELLPIQGEIVSNVSKHDETEEIQDSRVQTRMHGVHQATQLKQSAADSRQESIINRPKNVPKSEIPVTGYQGYNQVISCGKMSGGNQAASPQTVESIKKKEDMERYKPVLIRQDKMQQKLPIAEHEQLKNQVFSVAEASKSKDRPLSEGKGVDSESSTTLEYNKNRNRNRNRNEGRLCASKQNLDNSASTAYEACKEQLPRDKHGGRTEKQREETKPQNLRHEETKSIKMFPDNEVVCQKPEVLPEQTKSEGVKPKGSGELSRQWSSRSEVQKSSSSWFSTKEQLTFEESARGDFATEDTLYHEKERPTQWQLLSEKPANYSRKNPGHVISADSAHVTAIATQKWLPRQSQKREFDVGHAKTTSMDQRPIRHERHEQKRETEVAYEKLSFMDQRQNRDERHGQKQESELAHGKSTFMDQRQYRHQRHEQKRESEIAYENSAFMDQKQNRHETKVESEAVYSKITLMDQRQNRHERHEQKQEFDEKSTFIDRRQNRNDRKEQRRDSKVAYHNSTFMDQRQNRHGRHEGPPEGRHGRHEGPPEGRHERHEGPPEGRHGRHEGPPDGRHGRHEGPPEGRHGRHEGPPEGRHERHGPPEGRDGRHEGPAEGRHGRHEGPAEGRYGRNEGPPEGRYERHGPPEGRHGRHEGPAEGRHGRHEGSAEGRHGRHEGPAEGRHGRHEGPPEGRHERHGPPEGRDGRHEGPPEGRDGRHKGSPEGRNGRHEDPPESRDGRREFPPEMRHEGRHEQPHAYPNRRRNNGNGIM